MSSAECPFLPVGSLRGGRFPRILPLEGAKEGVGTFSSRPSNVSDRDLTCNLAFD